MEVIYDEDLVKSVTNKYLAVNVAAKRAREINANGLPVAPANSTPKQKPVSIATQELVEGKLSFKRSEAKAATSELSPIFTDSSATDEWRDTFVEDYIERESDLEEEEAEEGL